MQEKDISVLEMEILVPEEEEAALTPASYTRNQVDLGYFWPLKAIFSNN